MADDDDADRREADPEEVAAVGKATEQLENGEDPATMFRGRVIEAIGENRLMLSVPFPLAVAINDLLLKQRS